MRLSLPVIFLALLSTHLVSAQVANADEFDALTPRAKRSVALITAEGRNDAPPQRASGFAIQCPIDRPDTPATNRRTIIISSAHVLAGGPRVSAQFFGHPTGLVCDLVGISFDRDLMAIAPRLPDQFVKDDIPCLDLDFHEVVYKDQNIPIEVFGWPLGQKGRPFRGYINVDPDPARTIFKSAYKDASRHPLFLAPDTKLLQYSGSQCPDGVSGGPVFSAGGRVIAIQCAAMTALSMLREGNGGLTELALPTKENVDYGVPASYLRELVLDSEPDRYFKKAQEAFHYTADSLVKYTSSQDHSISLDGQEVNVGCTIAGPLRGSATDIIDRFIPDAKTFRLDFGTERLADLCHSESLNIVSNPAFGFRLLAPADASVVTSDSKIMQGARILLTHADGSLAEPYDQVAIYAFQTKPYFEGHISEWKAVVAKQFPGRTRQEIAADPPEETRYRGIQSWFSAHQAMEHFEKNILHLVQKGEDSFEELDSDGGTTGKVFSLPVAERDTRSGLTAKGGALAGWLRRNYVSDDADQIRAVHCCVWGDVAVIVAYICHKSDADAFVKGGKPSRCFIEQRLIRSSLSFY